MSAADELLAAAKESIVFMIVTVEKFKKDGLVNSAALGEHFCINLSRAIATYEQEKKNG